MDTWSNSNTKIVQYKIIEFFQPDWFGRVSILYLHLAPKIDAIEKLQPAYASVKKSAIYYSKYIHSYRVKEGRNVSQTHI